MSTRSCTLFIVDKGFCLNPEYNEKVRTWAAQSIALVLLSMPKPNATEALARVESIVPGIRKFVSKFVRSHQNLLQFFPPEGLPSVDTLSSTTTANLWQKLSPDRADGPAEQHSFPATNSPPADEASLQGEGVRDALEFFEGILRAEALDETIQEAKQSIASRQFLMRVRNAQLSLQDLMIELRKEKEGRNISIEQEIRYWNAVRRLEYVQKSPDVKHVTILLEISRLMTNDLITIREAALSLLSLLATSLYATSAESFASTEFDGASVQESNASVTSSTALQDKRTPSQRTPEWPVIFASELVSACAFALRTVFNQEVIQRGTIQFRDTAEALTKFTQELVKMRKVLCPISPSQLKSLFKAVFSAMASHVFWQGIMPPDTLVKQLNDIMGNQLMSIVSPRTA